jgi:hypothetical protein
LPIDRERAQSPEELEELKELKNAASRANKRQPKRSCSTAA